VCIEIELVLMLEVSKLLTQILGNEKRGCVQKFPDWPPGARTANGIALCQYVQLHRYFVSQSNEFCRRNPLCCFSTSVVVVVVDFVIDSVRKLLDTPLHVPFSWCR
jgi:hypothetical protein